MTTTPLVTAEAVRDLVEVHRLLAQAQAEADARAIVSRWALADVVRADVLHDLVCSVHLLFPAGVVPGFGEWPAPTGADILHLLAQAGLLMSSRPIGEFPAGTGAVVARLVDADRDFS